MILDVELKGMVGYHKPVKYMLLYPFRLFRGPSFKLDRRFRASNEKSIECVVRKFQ